MNPGLSGLGALSSDDTVVSSLRQVIVMFGDSNVVGIGVATTADRDFAVTVSNPAWKLNSRYASSVGAGSTNTYADYPSFRTLADGSLYAAPGAQCMGFEMSLGAQLVARGMPTPIIVKQGVVGSTLAVEWNPTGSYPAAGAGNLFNLGVTQATAIAATAGRKVAAAVVSLSTNDASSGPQSAAFGANMATFCPALRTALGNPNLLICWIKMNPDPAGPANFAAVIAAQVAYAATDPLCLLIDQADTLLVGDHLHNTDNGYLTIGQRCANAIATALGYPKITVAGAPAWVGFGPMAASTTNPTGVSYGGEIDGDLQVASVRMQVVSAVVPSVATPSGWTLVGNTNTAQISSVTESHYIFTRPVTTALLNANNGHMPPTTWVTSGGTGNAVKIRTLRGPSLNPTVDASAFTAGVAGGTGPVTVPALTTGAANTRVSVFTGGFSGGAATTMTESNGTLAGFAEFSDSIVNVSANNIVDAVGSGTLAAAGTSSTFSTSSSASVIQCNAVVSFKP